MRPRHTRTPYTRRTPSYRQRGLAPERTALPDRPDRIPAACRRAPRRPLKTTLASFHLQWRTRPPDSRRNTRTFNPTGPGTGRRLQTWGTRSDRLAVHASRPRRLTHNTPFRPIYINSTTLSHPPCRPNTEPRSRISSWLVAAWCPVSTGASTRPRRPVPNNTRTRRRR